MRIPGQALRQRLTIEPYLGNLGDGDTYGPAEPVRAWVRTTVKVTGDAAGQTLATWATARVKPGTTVTGAAGAARRPAPRDRVTYDGQTRALSAVAPVQGPGTAVAYLELTVGD